MTEGIKSEKTFFIKNVSFAFMANLISLITSLLIIFILPKFIGVTQYSYYQLYIFYASYLGFLGIGWVDGIQLRYAGKYYDKLDKPLFFTELKIFTLIESIFSITILSLALFTNQSYSNKFVYIAIAICAIVYLPRAFLHGILQATGRIKDYSCTIIIEKTVHILCTILGLYLGKGSFEWFILSEIIGRILGSGYVYFICRDFYVKEKTSIISLKAEISKNISCGLILTFSNISSMLIVGIMRQFIIIAWNVETFGKISLVLSISNFILVFISSVALVFFPFLKRCPEENLSDIYQKVRTIISVTLLFLIILYLPIQNIFSNWLPKYASSLKYMVILFPMCLFESKTNLLTNTYLKALRLEKDLLAINIACVVLSFILAYISCKIIHLLDLVVILMLAILIFRSIISEVVLKKHMDIKIYKKIIFELFLVTIFIVSSYLLNAVQGLICYLTAYIVYLALTNKDIINTYKWLKNS